MVSHTRLTLFYTRLIISLTRQIQNISGLLFLAAYQNKIDARAPLTPEKSILPRILLLKKNKGSIRRLTNRAFIYIIA